MSAPSAPGLPDVDLSGITILVLEDDQDSRELFTTVLGQCGATVIEATLVSVAKVIVESRPVNLVVTDMALPYQDGASFLTWLRERPSDKGTPLVVAVTAFYERYPPVELKGYSAYFQKPVNIVDFISTVAALLGRRGKTRQK